mmetsp:Transcript_45788/g.74879  ORF Transcript_45788/g.74879 Transcript_45788/m.74879 type:complete len:318 (+) Transcript_45788:361-1314(+)
MRVRDHQWDGIWVRWPHSAMLSPAVPCVGGEGRGAGVPGIGGGWRRQASRHSSGMNVLVRGAATQGRTPAHSLSAAVVTAHAETFRSRHPGTCHRARRGIRGRVGVGVCTMRTPRVRGTGVWMENAGQRSPFGVPHGAVPRRLWGSAAIIPKDFVAHCGTPQLIGCTAFFLRWRAFAASFVLARVSAQPGCTHPARTARTPHARCIRLLPLGVCKCASTNSGRHLVAPPTHLPFSQGRSQGCPSACKCQGWPARGQSNKGRDRLMRLGKPEASLGGWERNVAGPLHHWAPESPSLQKRRKGTSSQSRPPTRRARAHL